MQKGGMEKRRVRRNSMVLPCAMGEGDRLKTYQSIKFKGGLGWKTLGMKQIQYDYCD